MIQRQCCWCAPWWHWYRVGPGWWSQTCDLAWRRPSLLRRRRRQWWWIATPWRSGARSWCLAARCRWWMSRPTGSCVRNWSRICRLWSSRPNQTSNASNRWQSPPRSAIGCGGQGAPSSRPGAGRCAKPSCACSARGWQLGWQKASCCKRPPCSSSPWHRYRGGWGHGFWLAPYRATPTCAVIQA